MYFYYHSLTFSKTGSPSEFPYSRFGFQVSVICGTLDFTIGKLAGFLNVREPFSPRDDFTMLGPFQVSVFGN